MTAADDVSIIGRIFPYGLFPSVLALCLFALFPVVFIASKGGAALFSVAAVAALIDAVRVRPFRLTTPPVEVLIVLALIAYGAASAAWSVDPALSLGSALHLSVYPVGAALMIAAVGRMDARAVPLILKAATAGLAVAAAIVGVEYVSDYTLIKLSRGLTEADKGWFNVEAVLNPGWSVLSIALWPLVGLAFLRGERVLGAAMLAASAIAIATGQSLAATLAIGFSIALFLLARVLDARVVAALLIGGFACGMIGAPMAARQIDRAVFESIPLDHWLQDVPYSMYHRLLILSYVGDQIAERPWLGHGLNTARVSPGNTEVILGRKQIVAPDGKGGAAVVDFEVFKANPLPLHPHNIGAQIWLELGVPGLAILLTLIGLLIRRIGAMTDARWRAGAFAGLTAWMVNSLFSFGVWQHWWLSVAVLSAVLWAVATRRDVPSS